MMLPELIDELEVSYPERFTSFESRYPDAMEAVIGNGVEGPDDVEDEELAESLGELRDDICDLLRI